MASMNKAILIGRVGQDPDLKYTTNGQAVCNISVATDEGYKDRNSGQKVEKTEWHKVQCWRQTAEFVAKYISKGRLVLIEGKIQTRKWQDQNGNDRYATEILAHNVQALDRDPNQQGNRQQQQSNQGGQQQGGYQQQGQGQQQQYNQQQGYQSQGQQQSGFLDDEDLGPAFPSEASGMDKAPF